MNQAANEIASYRRKITRALHRQLSHRWQYTDRRRLNCTQELEKYESRVAWLRHQV